MRMLLRFLLVLGLACCGVAAEDAGSEGWTIQSYRFSADENDWPKLPSAEGGEKEAVAFLRASHEKTVPFFANVLGLRLDDLKGWLAAYDPGSRTLVIRALPAVHDYLRKIEKRFLELEPHSMSFNVHVVEADGALLRSMMGPASTHADHSVLWEQMQKRVDQGQARSLGQLHLDSTSAQRVSQSSGREHNYALTFALDDRSCFSDGEMMRLVGTQVEIDPMFFTESHNMEMALSLEHHYSPPSKRSVPIFQEAARRTEAQATDFHSVKLSIRVSVRNGGNKLLGVWKPEVTDPQRPDVLQAAFLTANAIPTLPQANPRLTDLLKKFGDSILPTPAAHSYQLPPPEAPKPGEMFTRIFRVPPDFLKSSGSANHARESADGIQPRPTTTQILETAGIPFPKGSWVGYGTATSGITVHNTPENLDKIEAYVDGLRKEEGTDLTCTLHVVQAEAKMLRDLVAQVQGQTDHSAAWHAVEQAVTQGKAKILNIGWLETRSDERTALRSGAEFMTLLPPTLDDEKPSSEGAGSKGIPAKPASPQRWNIGSLTTFLGMNFELMPTLRPDKQTIDVNFGLTWHYAPPSLHEGAALAAGNGQVVGAPSTDFHRATLTGSFPLFTGAIRLLGVWKPEGTPEFNKGDVLQAAFLRMDVVTLEEAAGKK